MIRHSDASSHSGRAPLAWLAARATWLPTQAALTGAARSPRGGRASETGPTATKRAWARAVATVIRPDTVFGAEQITYEGMWHGTGGRRAATTLADVLAALADGARADRKVAVLAGHGLLPVARRSPGARSARARSTPRAHGAPCISRGRCRSAVSASRRPGSRSPSMRAVLIAALLDRARAASHRNEGDDECVRAALQRSTEGVTRGAHGIMFGGTAPHVNPDSLRAAVHVRAMP